MTISTTIIKNSYSGNGSTTAFTYNFKIAINTEIEVIVKTNATGAESIRSLGSGSANYGVSGVGNNSGTVTFVTAPLSTETVVLRRSTAQTQAMDLIDNDPMSAGTIETAHDKAIAISQELQEQLNRSIKISKANTMTSTEFTVSATDRANKILAFDAAGEISVTQELGTFKGSDTTTTTAAYVQRDIIKSTTTAQLNNIYICVGDSVVGDTLTDTDHFQLLVDAVSAATSATNAAASEAAAASSATDAQTAQTAAETAETNAETAETNAETAETNAATSETNAANSATASANSASAAAASFDLFDDSYLGAKATNPSVDNDGNALSDGALYFDTTNDVMKVYDLATTTWLQLTPTVSNQTNINAVNANSTNINAVAANETNINNVNSNSANINIVAGIDTEITNVSGISAAVSAVNTNSTNINAVNNNSTNINTVAGLNTEITALGASGTVTSINTVANNLADINAFANIYLGPQSSAPTVDPDGSALDVGDLYFDTVSNTMKVYSSGGWIAAGSAVNGTANRFEYTATAGQTTFTGGDSNSAVLAYDAGFIDVYLNGIKLANSDYTATNGTSVVLGSGAALNDILMIVAFGTFSLSNFSINDANDVSTTGVSDGQVLVYNNSNSRFQPGNASSAEVYGFNKDSNGNLIVTTTDGGNDNISSATFATFDDVLFSASGFTFSIDANGDLISTI